MQTQIAQGIAIDGLRKLLSPLRSLAVQVQIVDDIDRMQQQAAALRQQALQKRDAAKPQVELLILGGNPA